MLFSRNLNVKNIFDFEKQLGGLFETPYNKFYENDKLFFEFNFCGLNKEDIDISIDGDYLNITSRSKDTPKREYDIHYFVYNTSQNVSILLDKECDKDSVKAEFKNGLLTLSFDKIKKSKLKSIEIK